MTASGDHPLVRRYLHRFDAVAAQLPESRRAQLRAEVADHLRESTSPDMPDADVRAVIGDLGEPGVIVGEEAAAEPSTVHRAWIVGGSLILLSVILGYVLPWTDPVPFDVPLRQLTWAAGILVLALATPSVTARRPLGTGALVALALWVVADAIADGIISAIVSRDLAGLDANRDGLIALGYVEEFGAFALALVAVVQIARIEVVPRPWRWAPAWVLGAVTATWLLQAVVAVTLGEEGVGLIGALSALDGITRVGGTAILGLLALALGAGVIRRLPPRYRGPNAAEDYT